MSTRHASTAPASAAATIAKVGTQPPSPSAEDGGQQGESPARDQRIRELAYSLYVERGGGEGHALDDWLLAESKLAVVEGNGSARMSAKAR